MTQLQILRQLFLLFNLKEKEKNLKPLLTVGVSKYLTKSTLQF